MSTHLRARRLCPLVLALLLASLLGAGCSGGASASLDALDLTVGYADFDLNPLPAEGQPTRVKLSFPPIPGVLFGNPGSLAAFQVDAEVGETTHVDLASLPSMATLALPVTSPAAEPAECRLVRFATFPLDVSSGEPIGGGAFLEPASRDLMILVYVDQACLLTGDLPLGNELYSVEADLPAAGFHWLRVEELEETRFKVRRHQLAGPALFVIVRPPSAG